MANGTIQQKDTTFTKIFVGGLPYHTSDKSLREFFDQFGDIEEAVVITDRQTGKSRGYGFVTMATKDAAERACKDPNPIIDGRKANVNLAYLGAKPRGIQTERVADKKNSLPLRILHFTPEEGRRMNRLKRCDNNKDGKKRLDCLKRTFPFAIKGFPSVLPGQYGGYTIEYMAPMSKEKEGDASRYPQYIYPSTAAANAAAAAYMTTPSVLVPHSSLSPTAGGQFVEYATPPYTGQFQNSYEAYPYTTATNGYVTPAAYTYAVPQAIAAGAGHFQHFQAQQIQERL